MGFNRALSPVSPAAGALSRAQAEIYRCNACIRWIVQHGDAIALAEAKQHHFEQIT